MEPFKNNFSPALVSCLTDQLARQLPEFDRENFVAGIVAELDALELKQRVQLIADRLHAVLPESTASRHRVLLSMLHPLEYQGDDYQCDERGVRGWGVLPLTAVVGQHGLADFEASLELLKRMTGHFSAEMDVRYFLLADQDRALGIMSGWIDDPNHHVRRLVSEGTRPRLPWAMQLPRLVADPTATLPLLEALRDDHEEYVRRSVANHLNDISRDHPDLVAELTRQWMRDADGNRQRLLRHACRSLIKQGHPQVLEAFGYGPPKIAAPVLAIETPRVEFGQRLEFTLGLESTGRASQSLLIDYLLHFKKSNGKQAAKVFKWTRVMLEPGARVLLRRAHAIRPITTRRYYPGEQALSLRINGEDFGHASFELVGVPGES